MHAHTPIRSHTQWSAARLALAAALLSVSIGCEVRSKEVGAAYPHEPGWTTHQGATATETEVAEAETEPEEPRTSAPERSTAHEEIDKPPEMPLPDAWITAPEGLCDDPKGAK